MILLNFAHLLTPDQLTEIEELAGQSITEVRGIAAHFSHEESFVHQVSELVDALNIDAAKWQTERILINPPTLNVIAVTVLTELHGRMGHFPALIRISPVAGSTPTRYEVAEVINLQAVRDRARERRQSTEA